MVRWLPLALVLAASNAHARVILQYFETDWREIERRMPELILAGYDALWLPPPQKGAEGVRDVGFSVFDRFDLGDRDQRGTVRTRYGTRAEFVAMCDAAHRAGVRVVFDVVMNHNANPSLIENAGVNLPVVGLDGFPETVPLDYHVLPARALGDGAFEALQPGSMGGGMVVLRPGTPENEEPFVAAVPMPPELAARFPGYTHLVRAPRIIFDGSTSLFELQSYSLLGLADFAIDLDGMNATTGTPLPSFVRQPDCPACYPDGVPRAETVVEYLLRWIDWLAETTGADGFRLDAVRHASTQFFERFDRTIQESYAARHGRRGRAQIFGESYTGDIFGELAAYSAAGMQMLNFPLFFAMQGMFSTGAGGGGDIGQLSFPQGGDAGALNEFGGLGREQGVAFVQSHDNGPPDGQPNLAYAFIMTRPGDAVVFFDGNNPDPRDFVQAGRADALGELSSRTIVDLVYVHDHFARGGMWNRYVDADAYVYERAVAGKATLLVALNDSLGAEARFGENDARPLLVTGFPPGTVLRDATGAAPDATVLDPAKVSPAQVSRALAEHARSSQFPPPPGYGLVYLAVPKGPEHGYVMYAPRTPLGPKSGARALSLLQAGQRVPDVVVRTAGEKHTAAGARVPARDLDCARVTGAAVTLQLRIDATAERAFAIIDGGGAGGLQGTEEGAFDGMVEMRAAGSAGEDRLWEVGPVNTTALAEGLHVARARAARRAESGALVWSTFAAPFVVTRGGGGATPVEPVDRDGDGVATVEDDCPDVPDEAQADFDADGVGDLCDFCPDDGPAPLLDGDGCRALGEAAVEKVRAAADAVVGGRGALVNVVRVADEVNR